MSPKVKALVPLISGLILLMIVSLFPASASAQSWLDPAWGYRMSVTVDNSGNASPLTNYPVRVDLGTGFDFNHAQSGGEDVRFTAADGTTLLDYWIEFWDNVGDSAIVWVEVPPCPPRVPSTCICTTAMGPRQMPLMAMPPLNSLMISSRALSIL